MMVTTNYDSYDDRWRGRIGGGRRVESVRQPLLLVGRIRRINQAEQTG
jgi:hypothetical protein